MRLFKLLSAALLILVVAARPQEGNEGAGKAPDTVDSRLKDNGPKLSSIDNSATNHVSFDRQQEPQKNEAGTSPKQRPDQSGKTADTSAGKAVLKDGGLPGPKVEPPKTPDPRSRTAESEAIRLKSYQQTIEERRAANSQAQVDTAQPQEPKAARSKYSRRKPLTKKQQRVKTQKFVESMARNKAIKQGKVKPPQPKIEPNALLGKPKKLSPTKESERKIKFRETITKNKELNAQRRETRRRLQQMTPEQWERELEKISKEHDTKEQKEVVEEEPKNQTPRQARAAYRRRLRGMTDKEREEELERISREYDEIAAKLKAKKKTEDASVDKEPDAQQSQFKPASRFKAFSLGTAWSEQWPRIWRAVATPFSAVPLAQRVYGTAAAH